MRYQRTLQSFNKRTRSLSQSTNTICIQPYCQQHGFSKLNPVIFLDVWEKSDNKMTFANEKAQKNSHNFPTQLIVMKYLVLVSKRGISVSKTPPKERSHFKRVCCFSGYCLSPGDYLNTIPLSSIWHASGLMPA